MVLKECLTALILCLPALVHSLPSEVSPLCGVLPENLTLTTQNPKLPDPFTFLNGDKVVTKDDFACRQAEVSALFQRFELGDLPPRPESITSTVTNRTNLAINVSNAGKSISFSVTIKYPTSGTGPFPAVIGMGGVSLPLPSNVAVITFNNNDMALQNNLGSRGIGKFYDLYGADATASSMIAWTWGVSRIIDVLESTEGNLNIDILKLGVTGCSRNGKGALVAGAFEPRIALTLVQESGSGGAGCWRISDAMLASGITTQTASEIVQENVWFARSFEQFVNDTSVLPFDHHMLAGLVAPRPLLIIDNTGIDWLGPESVFGCMKTANKIWQALGIPDHMGVSQVGNHNHCAFPAVEQPDLTPFFDKFFGGNLNANTSVIKTDGPNDLGFVDSDWIDWTVPSLA